MSPPSAPAPSGFQKKSSGQSERLNADVARAAGAGPHQPAVEQGEEGLHLVPLRVVDRVARGHRQLRRRAGDRAAHGVEGTQRGVDRVRGERLLRALHGHDLGVPRVGEVAVEELEPGRRLDVGELQVGDVSQAEQRAPGAGADPGPGSAQVLAHQVRLALDDLDRPVGRAGPPAQHRARPQAAIGGQRRASLTAPAHASRSATAGRRSAGGHQHRVRADRQRDPAARRKLHGVRGGELGQDRGVAEVDGDPAGRAQERRGDHGAGQRPGLARAVATPA